jgi:hypothetical protein
VRTASRRAPSLGSLLIVIIGVLNCHPPHFLIESGGHSSTSTLLLEAALLVTLLAAVVAAIGIHCNLRWGWWLGTMIACVCVVLYVLQETVGLPGLPKTWWEPSRIVSLAVETFFVILARYQLGNPPDPTSP